MVTVDREGRAGNDPERLALPDIADLAARLRFSADEGRIWLDDQRMMLLHLGAFAALREELVGRYGLGEARSMFYRMGYQSGARDAELVRKVRPNRKIEEAFAVGPQMHMLEGIVRVEPVRLEMDVENGHYLGEFIWYDSIEADAHLSLYGVGTEPACWMQLGYASGYTSAFVGRPIAYRELDCRCMGHPNCRILGKPAEAWPDREHDPVRIVVPEELCPDAAKPVAPGDEKRMVGASSGFIAAFHRLEQVAPTNTTVLLLGETGVGKERFARMLHESSERSGAPFVAVNCSAMPRELIESELFGVVRGAYTGANEDRPGRFERANGGTLFLDEIATMALPAQAKLLRALQEREVERVGGTKTVPVNVRVVAATNVNLRSEVEAGRFRADLYYRLSVFPIRVPPLRERRDDIPRLIEHFVFRFAATHGKKIPGLTNRAVDALLDYDYPGNIRELENMIERAVILAQPGSPLDVHQLFDSIDPVEAHYLSLNRRGELSDARSVEPASELESAVGQILDASASFDEIETLMLETAVDRAHGNLSHAAKLLGLTRPQLVYRLKKRLSHGGSEPVRRHEPHPDPGDET
jgi:DNA-binding NtrC family response regulator/predicted hydrocarbon binding protein